MNITAGDSETPHLTAQESPPAAEDSYAPASDDRRNRTRDSVVIALQRLQYLELEGSTYDGLPKQMVQVRLRGKRTPIASEIIKADLRTIWRLDVAQAGRTIYRIEDRRDGFDFRFALLYESSEYVTGLIAVHLAEARKGYAT